jgi:hypothetical protein
MDGGDRRFDYNHLNWTSPRESFMASLVTLMLAALILPQSGEVSWHAHYERGVELVEAGDGGAAIVELEKALAARPEPGLRLRTEGLRSIDYLPHLFLAVALHMVGDVERAGDELAAAEKAGVAVRSEFGLTILEAYQLLLGRPVSDSQHEPAPELAQGLREFDRKPEVLSDEEFAHARGEILQRCGLPPHTGDAAAPWYFHYEIGVAMVERGDPQRGLDALIAATDRRPMSQRNARLYGMWFTDYRPYLEIAKAHVQLGNYRCAFDALELSRRLDEVDEGDDDFDTFVELSEEAAAHIGQATP